MIVKQESPSRYGFLLVTTTIMLAGAAFASESRTVEGLEGHWAGYVAIHQQGQVQKSEQSDFFINRFSRVSMDFVKKDGKIVAYVGTLIGVYFIEDIRIEGDTFFFDIPETLVGNVSFMGLFSGNDKITYIFNLSLFTGYGVAERKTTVGAAPLTDEEISGVYFGGGHSSMITESVDLSLKLNFKDGVPSGSVELPKQSLDIAGGHRAGNEFLVQLTSADGTDGYLCGSVEEKGKLEVFWRIGPGAAGGYMWNEQAKVSNEPVGPSVRDNRLNFDLTDLTGNRVALDETRFAGKALLVDIWGTWCPPCIAEIPHLVKLHEKYRNEGFEIIGVAFESSDYDRVRKVQIEEFAKEHGIAYTLVDGKAHGEEVEKVFPDLQGFNSFPTAILIDRTGKVQELKVGFAEGMEIELEEAVKRILK